MKSILANLLTCLVVVGALVIYDQYFRHQNGPVGPAPDPAVVKLGGLYAKALQDAASTTLEATSQAAWTTTSEAVALNRKQFQAKLEDAFKPVSAELTRRFGAVTDQPATPATASAVRSFCHDLADGVKQGGK